MCCIREDELDFQMMAHQAVMVEECLRLLQAERAGHYLDATFGGGGHSRAILESSSDSTLLALDQDPAARSRAAVLSSTFSERFAFRHMNFRNINELKEHNFSGILFDLGVSSFQLDEAARGFSFRFPAQLDMRMNPEGPAPAFDFLESAPRDELVRAVRDYGEERSWRRVVDAIIDARGTGKLQQTDTFADLLLDVIPQRYKKGRKTIHPATLTFQGIRIAINDELGAITAALPLAFEQLATSGVLVVISFHSLEDRIVKRFFRKLAGRPEHSYDSTSSQDRICIAEELTRKPLSASETETNQNPRARSAKLRAIRKL